MQLTDQDCIEGMAVKQREPQVQGEAFKLQLPQTNLRCLSKQNVPVSARSIRHENEKERELLRKEAARQCKMLHSGPRPQNLVNNTSTWTPPQKYAHDGLFGSFQVVEGPGTGTANCDFGLMRKVMMLMLPYFAPEHVSGGLGSDKITYQT